MQPARKRIQYTSTRTYRLHTAIDLISINLCEKWRLKLEISLTELIVTTLRHDIIKNKSVCNVALVAITAASSGQCRRQITSTLRIFTQSVKKTMATLYKCQLFNNNITLTRVPCSLLFNYRINQLILLSYWSLIHWWDQGVLVLLVPKKASVSDHLRGMIALFLALSGYKGRQFQIFWFRKLNSSLKCYRTETMVDVVCAICSSGLCQCEKIAACTIKAILINY